MRTLNGTKRKARLAILTNTLAPYRLPIYAALAECFETVVLHGGRERNRSWALEMPPGLRTRRVWTLQVPLKKQTGVKGVWDTQYLHLNVGLLWWLPFFRADAIATNELGLRTLVALAYGRLMRVPVWVSSEGTTHSERNVGGLKLRLRGWLAARVRHWISYGLSSTEYLHSLGVEPTTILQVQNCVPQEIFLQPASAVRPLPDEPSPLILSVGQLIPRKGLDRLVAACGRLAASGSELTLVLVGEGPERERLQEQARGVGLRHFHLLPNQPQAMLNELYRRADAFVIPTLEDVWGLVVNEALWAGTPVLCSRYAGCAAELLPAENLFDPMSDASFDAALRRVLGGDLEAVERSPLKTWQEVGQAIASAVRQEVLRTQPGRAEAFEREATVYSPPVQEEVR